MKIEHLQIDKVKCFKNGNGGIIRISWEDTECMCTNEDKEFIRMVLNKWVDDMEVEE